MKRIRIGRRAVTGIAGLAVVAGTVTGTAGPAAAAGYWSSVSAGQMFTCGIQTNGSLWCWGYNAYGQLGIGFATTVPVTPTSSDPAPPHATPQQVGTGTDWRKVDAGGYHACGIRAVPGVLGSRGTLWCWGRNTSGQLGLGDRAQRLVPTQVGTLTDWVTVATGGNHTCATRSDKSLWCWGDNYAGQLGTGTGQGSSVVPVQVGPGATWYTLGLTAGPGSNCALLLTRATVPGQLMCWGYNGYGQLGVGDTVDRPLPTPVSSQGEWWLPVAVGMSHACGFQQVGGFATLWCWGDNRIGQLGVGDMNPRLVPEALPVPASMWQQVAAGVEYTCGVQGDQSMWCWGRWTTTPTRIGAGTLWKKNVDISTSSQAHACNIATDGSLWCWGNNWHGQLGLGDGVGRPAPVRLP